MAKSFKSPKGEIPEIDPNKLDLITSLLTTFESNDLHTRNALNFRYDHKTDYVFLELLAVHNGQELVDYVFGYDKEKMVNVCNQILDYFSSRDGKKNG
jgi:hypothetical protein